MKLLSATLAKAESNKRIIGASGIGLVSVLAIWRLARRLLRPRQHSQPPDKPPSAAQTRANPDDGATNASSQTSQSFTPTTQTTILRRTLSGLHGRGRLLWLVALALASILTAVYFYRPRPTYYVAYVGRYQRAGSSFDDLHERALQKYIDELNEGLTDFRLDLKIFSIKKGADVFDPRPVYEEIAKNKDFVLVVDNTWGSDLKSVADLIRAKGVPVISINADKLDVDYSGNVAFIGYDDNVPVKVARFTEKILNDKDVIFITEESYGLTKPYEEQLRQSGIDYARLSVKTPKWNPDEEKVLLDGLDAALGELRLRKESPTVVLNVHSNWGGPVIKHVDTRYENVTLLGGPYVIPSAPDYVFGSNDNGNRLIMFTYPHDAVSDRVLKDLADIKVENPSISSIPNAQLFVKRCLDAASIIGGGVAGPPERKSLSKADFLSFFRGKLARGVKVVAPDDLYSFDANLLLDDERSFEERFRDRKVSYRYQLNRVNGVIPNLYFGIDHIEISNVNLKARTFHANFIVWVTPNRQYDDIFDSIIFRNLVGSLDHKRLTGKSADGVSAYYRVSGDFSMDVDVRRYPFDTQELTVALQIINHTTEKLHISFVDGGGGLRLSDNEWDMRGVRVTTDNVIVSSPGERAGPEEERAQKIKTTNLRIKVERRWVSPLVMIIFPLVMMGCVAVAVLFVEDGSFANVGNVCAAIFLGMVAYALAFMQMTPRSDGLTIADALFYVTFFAVLLIFLKVVVSNSSITRIGWVERVVNYLNDKTLLVGYAVGAAYLLLMVAITFYGLVG